MGKHYKKWKRYKDKTVNKPVVAPTIPQDDDEQVEVAPIPVEIVFGVSVDNSLDFVRASSDNVVQYGDAGLPADMIENLLFRDVGGTELISLSRHDIIDGIRVNYSLIGNLTELQKNFNSNNIISGIEDRYTYFKKHQVDIGQHVQSSYFDNDGNLIIEFDDISSDYTVEIMMLSDGIIYTT